MDNPNININLEQTYLNKINEIKDKIRNQIFKLRDNKSENVIRLYDKLIEFDKKLDSLISEISDTRIISDRVNHISISKQKYDKFLDELKNVNKIQSYDFDNNQRYYFKDNTDDRLFTDILEIWKIFGINPDEIDNDPDAVISRIGQDSKSNIQNIQLFNDLLDNLTQLMLESSNIIQKYKLISKYPNKIEYKYGQNDFVDTGDIILLNDQDKLKNMTKVIDFGNISQQDGLEVIEANKFELLKNYISIFKDSPSQVTKIDKNKYEYNDFIKKYMNQIHDIESGNNHTFLLGGHVDETNQINELIDNIRNINKKLDLFKLQVDKYNQYKIDYMYYVMYMTYIVTFDEKIEIYRYIDWNTLNKYKMIIDQIKNDNSNNIYLYFEKYHYIIFNMMSEMLNFLVLTLDKDKNDMIDISRSTGHIKVDFAIFNHFITLLKRV